VNILYILGDVLKECEAWSLKLREERRLTVFEIVVLSIPGLK
jgi:hypothetical protein